MSQYPPPSRVTTITTAATTTTNKEEGEEGGESEDDNERGVLQLELHGGALLLHGHTDILVEGGQCHLDHPI